MLDLMQKTIESNLLKYSAGMHITCPHCKSIADYRRWVIAESPTGANMWQGCITCWAEKLVDINEKAHVTVDLVYLTGQGWTITTMSQKAPKSPRGAYPQKAGRVLDTFLRKDILKGHKRNGGYKVDRFFPEGYRAHELIEIPLPDGAVDIQYAGDPVYSRHQVDTYVAEYCRLNNLKG